MTRNATAAMIFVIGLCAFVLGVLMIVFPLVIAGPLAMIAGAMYGNHYRPGGNP